MSTKYLLIASLITLACFSLSCSNQENDRATVIKNLNGYTFYDGELRQFSSIAFKKGKVIDVYDDTTFKNDGQHNIIDGGGKVMLPGLTDAHAHVMGLGYQELDVNIAGIKTLDKSLQKVEQHAKNHPQLKWVRGRGWNHTRWSVNRYPTAKELDGAVEERPVWLNRVDGHAGWANSKAMEMAGIGENTKAPSGGKIIRDEDGNPTGIFVDAATQLIEDHLPERSLEEKEMALTQALQKMRQNGMTGVHVAGIHGDIWNLFKQFADNGKLTTRMYAMIRGVGADFDSLSVNGPVDSYDHDMLALRSIKLYADGALGSRGAAMIKPYSDDPDNRGLLFSSQEKMNNKVLKAQSKGYQVNVHAIGDRANWEVLNAFANARDSLGDQGLRNRIEHAQIVAPDDIPRFKSLDVLASMQPTHATSDMNMAEDRIGKKRIEGAYAWQKFLDQGTVVPFGSDFPVEHVNPFYGIYSAVTRQDHEGNPSGGWYPSQRVSREQALRSFTLDAAYAAHQEDMLGSLEPGKWADFILVDQDIFEADPIKIWQTKVLQTWVAGNKVYSANK